MTDTNKSRTQKGIDSKNKIFKAAIELIKTKNYDDITVREICSTASISIGQFYHHFKSKQDILTDFVRIEDKDIKNFYNSIKDETPYNKLIKSIEYQLHYFTKKGRKFISILLNFDTAEISSSKGFYDNAIYKVISDCITEGQDSGEFFSKYSHDFLVECISNQLIGSTYSWIIYGDNEDAYTELYPQLKELIDILILH